MITWLARSSLRLTPVVVAAAALMLVLGVAQVRQAPLDALPEFGSPTVEIQVEAPGLAAVEVEQLITVPMEDELNGIAWIDHLTSRSIPGLADLTMTFQGGTDLLRDRQLVAERLAQGPGVANVGAPPTMIQPTSALSRVMMVGLSSSSLPLVDLSTLARWRIRPRLMGVPGVANVSIWGQRDQQLQVLVDPIRLSRSGITLEQVLDTTSNALWSSPLTFVEASTPGADGFVDTPNQRLSIQHVLPITNPDQLAQVPVADTGDTTVRLGDVTTVVTGHPPLIGDAVVGDQTSLVLVVEKFPGANTRQVTADLQAALDSLRPGLQGVRVDPTVFRPAGYLDSALHNLGWWSLLAVALVVVLLSLLLYAWRLALVSAVAILLSLVVAGYVLYLTGTTFTLITAAGLALAISVIVDDAVDGTLRLADGLAAASGAEPQSKTEVLADAVGQLGRSAAWATAVIALIAVPVYTIGGVVGAIAQPVVTAYLVAILVSGVVAVTLTPALAWVLLRGPRTTGAGATGGRRGQPASLMTRGLGAAMVRFASWPALAAVVAVALAGGWLALAPQLRGNHQTLPDLQDRNLLVQWQSMPGTSAAEMDRLTTRISADLHAVPGVRGVIGEVGRAVASDQVVNVDSGQLWVNLAPSAEYEDTITEIHQVLDQYPGVRHDLLTYPAQQLRAAQAPEPDLTVRIFGTDYATLATQAARVREAVAATDGITGTSVATASMEPTITIGVDLAKAAAHGLKPGDVRRAAAALISGTTVGSLYQDQAIFDVVVWGEPGDRQSITSVQDLMIDTPSGALVRLGDVASVTVSPQPIEVDHYGASRYVDVAASVHGNPSSVLRQVQAAVSGVTFPQTYHAEVTSALVQRRAASTRTWLVVAAAAIGGYLVLQAAFASWRRANLLVVTLPLALSGGVVAARDVGGLGGIGALAGLLGVLAVAIRMGVRLIRQYQAMATLDETSAEASPTRAAPLAVIRHLGAAPLTSALVIAAAMAPFAIAGSGPGSEFIHPLAVVVLGGLATTVITMLFVVPAFLVRLDNGREPMPNL